MTTEITRLHKLRFEEIRKSLTLLGCREGNFLRVELLFYEVLNISRSYGNETEGNSLLANLIMLQQNQYQKTKTPTVKRNQREVHIRHFVNGFKRILSHHYQIISSVKASVLL